MIMTVYLWRPNTNKRWKKSSTVNNGLALKELSTNMSVSHKQLDYIKTHYKLKINPNDPSDVYVTADPILQESCECMYKKHIYYTTKVDFCFSKKEVFDHITKLKCYTHNMYELSYCRTKIDLVISHIMHLWKENDILVIMT